MSIQILNKKQKGWAIVWKDEWQIRLGFVDYIVSLHFGEKPVVSQDKIWEVKEIEFVIK